LIERIGFAVGTLVALGLSTPALAQDAHPLQRSPETTLSGYVRLEYFARDSSIEDLRARAAGLPASARDDTFLSPDARIRLDLKLPDVRFTAEVAALPYDDGSNLGLGDGGSELLLKQLFVDLEGIVTPDLTLRAGAFEYAWKVRPHGEPFLLDLGRAESFFSGAGDRDQELPGGALLKWRAGDFVEVEALWMTTIEGGAASADESVGALLANFPLSERSAVFLGALYVAGAADQRVATWGGGADTYFGDDRELEVFGEGWVQSGHVATGVSKRAWGAQLGARGVTGPWRAEASAAWRSGDDDPSDGRDETFQSYEGQERFRIVESAEFGLDWDVNVTSVRLSVARRIGDAAEARIDAGRFRMAASMAGLDRDLGLEVDASLTLEISRAASAWLAVAMLTGSDALESATAGGDDRAFLAALGVKAFLVAVSLFEAAAIGDIILHP
jgi:hypothetical protein